MKAKIAKIDPASPDAKVIQRAAYLIQRGEVLICPTDTGYALTANALDTRAVARVFRLKGRVYSNPIHMAVNSIEEADKYARVTPAATLLAHRYLPGALTLVLKRRENVPAILVAGLDTVGIRIPDNAAILRLVQATGLPLTTTSANISGKPPTFSVEEVVAQFGEHAGEIAFVIDQGPLKGREQSTIVDMSTSPPQLIRQGRISWLEIREELKRL
jgi:L-threonylcarbamoyladenylate synthase